jgi:hypothetical protein
MVLHAFRGAPKNSITSRSSYFELDLHIQTKKGPKLMIQSCISCMYFKKTRFLFKLMQAEYPEEEEYYEEE